MSAQPEELDHEPGVVPLVAEMLRTRLELAALDIEAHLRATIAALFSTFVALVVALIAFAFVGVAVIALAWDTHRVAATIGTLTAYVTLAVLAFVSARSQWRSRPAALAATLHELELDRQALGGHR